MNLEVATSFHDVNPLSRNRVLVLAEHAGKEMPPELLTDPEGHPLGITPEILAAEPNILGDTGVEEVTRMVAAATDTRSLMGRFSRLAIDLNRTPHSKELIASVAHGHCIPGNRHVSDAEKRRRMDRYYWPYQNAATQAIAAGNIEAVIGMHSYTPGLSRTASGEYLRTRHPKTPDVGVLYWGDDNSLTRIAKDIFTGAGLKVGDNAPYDPKDYGGEVSFEMRVIRDAALNQARIYGGCAYGRMRPHAVFEFALPLMQDAGTRYEIAKLVSQIVKAQVAVLAPNRVPERTRGMAVS